MADLLWLQSWYASQCDGKWEHIGGIEITTIDHPGWKVEVDASGAKHASLHHDAVEENYGDEFEWLRCWIEGGRFHAACGPRELAAVLDRFRGWIEPEAGK
jgi:Immunity protein 53